MNIILSFRILLFILLTLAISTVFSGKLALICYKLILIRYYIQKEVTDLLEKDQNQIKLKNIQKVK